MTRILLFLLSIASALPVSEAMAEQMVRIGICKGLAEVALSASGWRLYDTLSTAPIAAGSAAVRFTLPSPADARGRITDGKPLAGGQAGGGSIRVSWSGGSYLPKGALRLIPNAPDQVFFLSGKKYRGIAEIRTGRDALLTVINILPLEEYLYSVVPSEMSASWHPEALKAQAVAARSYSISNLGKHAADGYDLCNTTHCQGYGGTSREDPRSTAAVRQTAGKIITCNGSPADAVFSTACGGWTEDVAFVWGGDLPYLRSVPCTYDRVMDIPGPLKSLFRSYGIIGEWLAEAPDAGCRKYSAHRWRVNMTAPEAERHLNKVFTDSGKGRLKDIMVSERSPAGRAAVLDVIFDNGRYSIRGDKIRWALGGLKSTLFIIRRSRDADGRALAFEFVGGGWGHGAGMCQMGADSMARQGSSCEQILRHYYSNVAIEIWKPKGEL